MNADLVTGWDRPLPFTLALTPSAEHIDGLGHTNNAVYVQWCEKAGWAHSHALGLSLADYQRLDRAMAIRREIIPMVVPIPNFVESHDLWIALASNLAQSNLHIDEATLLKRKHGRNATSTVSTRSLLRKFWSRVIFALSLLVLIGRLRLVAR